MTNDRVTINVGQLLPAYAAALQHSLDVLTISLLGVDLVAADSYSSHVWGVFPELKPFEQAKLSFERAKDEAKRWHSCTALGDAIEATGLFLDNVFEVTAAARESAAGTLTRASLAQIQTARKTQFHGFGFARKISTLRNELSLKLDHYEHVFAVNRIRNCLVHRRGFVSALDVDSSGSLELSYPKLEMFSPYQDGSGQEIIIDRAGVAGAPGAPIMMRSVVRKRQFTVNERVSVTPSEVMDIFGLLTFFGMGVVDELQQLVPPTPPRANQGPTPGA